MASQQKLNNASGAMAIQWFACWGFAGKCPKEAGASEEAIQNVEFVWERVLSDPDAPKRRNENGEIELLLRPKVCQ